MLTGFVLAVLSCGAILVPASPAAAAFSASTAVGVGASGDARVWTAVDTVAGSLVRARTYVVGLPGAASDNQRWQWERVAVSETAGITFRIRNVASQRCLDATSAGVVINNCGTATTQRWRAPLNDPNGGWTLVNQGTSRCLSSRNDPNPGALVQTDVCNAGALQRWRMRPAPQDCTIRSRTWFYTDVCASQPAERMTGVMSNWNNLAVSMSWVDPEDYLLSNSIENQVTVLPLNPDLSQSQTGLDLGISVERSTQQAGGVTQTAFWRQWKVGAEEYRRISPTLTPGANIADERNHTFMALGNDAGQWDLLYDYNTVATTTFAAGGSTRFSRTGMAMRYPHAVTLNKAFGYRMRLMDTNQRWRQPWLSEIGLAEPKKCDTPPRIEDPIWDVVNILPNCITSSYKANAAVPATDPAVFEALGVGKPAAVTAAPAAKEPPARVTTVPGLHNGVDQSALAACLDDAANNCLDRVPGLAACVHARLICNVTAKPTVGPSGSGPMTSGEAIDKAKRTFNGLDGSESAVARKNGFSARSGAGFRTADSVQVVTSTSEVRSTGSAGRTYKGLTAVYSATDGSLLYACLGACQITDESSSNK